MHSEAPEYARNFLGRTWGICSFELSRGCLPQWTKQQNVPETPNVVACFVASFHTACPGKSPKINICICETSLLSEKLQLNSAAYIGNGTKALMSLAQIFHLPLRLAWGCCSEPALSCLLVILTISRPGHLLTRGNLHGHPIANSARVAVAATGPSTLHIPPFRGAFVTPCDERLGKQMRLRRALK